MAITPAALLACIDDDLLKPLCSETDVVAARQLRLSLLKKLRVSSTSETSRLAKAKFVSRLSCASPSLPDLHIARAYCHHVLGELPSPSEMLDGMRPGPGNSLQMTDSSTCAFVKIAYGESCVTSEEAYAEYIGLITADERWYSAELLRRYHFGMPELTPYNRITTVPKDNTIDRVIAVEPNINGILQQGLKSCIENRLVKQGVIFKSTGSEPTQAQRNQFMARLGSLGHGLATIDFSAASDSISVDLLYALLPHEWVSYILLLSSPSFMVDGERYYRGRVALTMGNAITFPLMTLIFRSLVVQTYRLFSHSRCSIDVWGDDVILSEDCAQQFIALCEQCGFTANSEKSFWTGEFRESCGADWFAGVNVRGVYIKALDSLQALYVARNLLWAWSYRHSISLASAIALIDEELHKRSSFNVVPPFAPGNSGVRCLESSDVPVFVEGSRYFMWRELRQRPILRSIQRYARVHTVFCMYASCAGWIREGFLMERPRVVRSGWSKTLQSSDWGWFQTAEAWLYDLSRSTSGFLSDELSVD